MNKQDYQKQVSIIVPVYNGEKTILSTLNSILKQTYDNFEIIIVDNGSDQPIKEYLRDMNDSRIQIYRIERSNANIARNFGILKSKGEYIAMLDADDRWLESHLQDCIDLLNKSGADGLYGGLFLTYNHTEKIDENHVFYARQIKEKESMIDYLLTTGYGAQTSSLFTIADASKNIMWDPKLIDHQDYDFVVRFNNKYELIAKQKPTVIYYLSSGRSNHYPSCIDFVEKNIGDVDPVIYNNYNLRMYLQALRANAPKEFISYFKKEAVRYKAYLSYQKYISICEPQTILQEIKYKFSFLYHLLKVKMDL